MEVFTGDRGLPCDVLVFPETHLPPFALPTADTFSDHHEPAIDGHPPPQFNDDHHFHPPQPPPQKLRPIRCNGRGLPDCCSSDDLPLDTKPLSWSCLASPDIGFFNAENDGGCSVPTKTCDSGASSYKECQFDSQLSSSSRESSELQEAIKEPVNMKKRKRRSRKKLELFFESMVRKLTEKQEEMHRQFLEVLEKKENERIMREEAWRKQEMERAMKEEAARAQEMARSLSLISYIKNLIGDEIQIPKSLETSFQDKKEDQYRTPNMKPTDNSFQEEGWNQGQLNTMCDNVNCQEEMQFDPSGNKEEVKFDPSGNKEEVKCDVSSSIEESECDPNNRRWPKSEVQALITVRAALYQKFNAKGLKRSVWDEVAAGLFNMGYNRTANKCKEKWDNINKYYRRRLEKGKEVAAKSNVCTYFGALEMLHKNGFVTSRHTHDKVESVKELNVDSDYSNTVINLEQGDLS